MATRFVWVETKSIVFRGGEKLGPKKNVVLMDGNRSSDGRSNRAAYIDTIDSTGTLEFGASAKLRASPPIEQLSPHREGSSRLHSRNVIPQKGLQQVAPLDTGMNGKPLQRRTSLVSFVLLTLAGYVGWKLATYIGLPAATDGVAAPSPTNLHHMIHEDAAANPVGISSSGRSSSSSSSSIAIGSGPKRRQLYSAPPLIQQPSPIMSPPPVLPAGAGAGAGAVDPGFQSYFDEIAVVVVGGIGRQEHLAAAYSSWTSVFKNKIFITDAPSADHAGPSGMANVLVNVYAGFETEADALREHTHPDHPIRKYLEHPEELANRKHFDKDMDAATRELFSSKHTLGWHLGQGKYLLGMKLAQVKFPDAKWYIIVDSDTAVFPERIVAGLHLQGRPSNVPVAIGAVYGAAKSALLPKFTSFLGGAGVVVNQAAMQKMNVSKCVDEQVNNLGWSMAPADWRMGLCLNKYNVKKSNEKYMYQGNEQLNCLPHGGPPQECAWGGHYGNVMSDCPLTLHYQTPVHMRELFDARTNADKGGVCVPAPHWRDFTNECDCNPPAKALEIGKIRPTKKGYQLPRGKHPTISS